MYHPAYYGGYVSNVPSSMNSAPIVYAPSSGANNAPSAGGISAYDKMYEEMRKDQEARGGRMYGDDDRYFKQDNDALLSQKRNY